MNLLRRSGAIYSAGVRIFGTWQAALKAAGVVVSKGEKANQPPLGVAVRGITGSSLWRAGRCPSPAGAAGRCEVPAGLNLKACRVFLEMDDLPPPEMAAAVKVNGKAAGGCIGRPYRVEVTNLLKAGTNAVEIQPVAPREARLVFLEK
jgi:hypothetical protein